ncbi:MAG: S24 family peptidase [Syntrophales bacterium]|nr:S24 family peptidase [Syntrophales bacterium]
MKEKRTLRSVRKILIVFFRETRRMPSYAEMIAPLGVRSKSVVYFWVEKLIAAGLLTRDEKGRLSLIQRPFAVALLGSVRAGFPSPEEEALCDILSMDEYLITRPEASFLLQVSGDSMNGAGIVEGDLVIVERGESPRGEIS